MGAETRRLILVGMMGSGKTTIGRLVGRAIGWPFFDNDELLAEATGRTARELADDGEEVLRAAESAALDEGLRRPEPRVVAGRSRMFSSAAWACSVRDGSETNRDRRSRVARCPTRPSSPGRAHPGEAEKLAAPMRRGETGAPCQPARLSR